MNTPETNKENGTPLFYRLLYRLLYALYSSMFTNEQVGTCLPYLCANPETLRDKPLEVSGQSPIAWYVHVEKSRRSTQEMFWACNIFAP